MNIFSRIKEVAVSYFPNTNAYLEALRDKDNENDFLKESLGRIQLEMENEGYVRLAQSLDHDFSRNNLESIIKVGVAMAIKNPITSRSVNVQADYVFGRGVKFVAKHPLVQTVIDEHIDFPGNKSVLYSHDSCARQEREFQVKGNLFFALCTNPRTGRVIVRDIDTTEVADIVRDPQDYRSTWFIVRTWTKDEKQHTTYHPALGITRTTPRVQLPKQAPADAEIDWDTPVYHQAFNRYGRMKFGVPEIYAQFDWAIAYKRFLEDWTSIMRAFSRMAMQVKGMANKKQAAAAKGLMQTATSISKLSETNPSAATASTAFIGKGQQYEPVKTAGATTPTKDGSAVLNMAAAAVGLPNTFYGDASVGNHATAKTLDRPTELKMTARQRLWATIFCAILDYVVLQAALAPEGILRAEGAVPMQTVCPFTDEEVITVNMPMNDDPYNGKAGEPISTAIEVKFPELLERNVTDRVRALSNALTMFGKPLTDLVPDKRLVCRWFLDALNIEDPESYIPMFVEMWTKNMSVGDDGKPVDPIIIPPAPPANGPQGAEDAAQGGDVGVGG
jgi:hypothetical protein